MARALWKGSIRFGLVSVPVRLQSAIAPKEVGFRLVHRADGGRIQLRRVCSKDGQEVPANEVARGYALPRGESVVIEPRDLERLMPETRDTVEILDFVSLTEIDPVFYGTPYYAQPETGAAQAYAMLVAALERTDRVAVGRIVMRGKEYLCTVRASGGVLVLSTMHYADEVVAPDQPQVDEPPRRREIDMAERLIDSMTVRFDPERYRDRYRERVLQLVENLATGTPAEVPRLRRRERPRPLNEALEQSLAETRRTAAPQRGLRRAPREPERVSARTKRAPTGRSTTKPRTKK